MDNQSGSSASASLNAAILAKKEAEKAKAAAEEADRLSRIAANKSVDAQTSGWWAKGDTGAMNAAEEKPAASKAFSPQTGLTGQSGIGSSLFNIKRTDPSEIPAAPVVLDVPSPDATATAFTFVNLAAALPEADTPIDVAAPSAAAAAVAATALAEFSSPKQRSAISDDHMPAGWGTQVGAGHLFENKETEDLDRRAKQGFTPQLVMGMGRSMFQKTSDGSVSSPTGTSN